MRDHDRPLLGCLLIAAPAVILAAAIAALRGLAAAHGPGWGR